MTTNDGGGLLMKYFVLNPTKRGPYGRASRAALLRYAQVIGRQNPQLEKELKDWHQRILDGFVDEDFAPAVEQP